MQPSQMNRSWTRPGINGGLDYPGQLPTLGLIKRPLNKRSSVHHSGGITMDEESIELPSHPGKKRYQPEDGGANPNNPFSREVNTEKLLIAKERERLMKELTRGDKESLRVFEKGTSTRQNRAGVIREINTIRASKKYAQGYIASDLALYKNGGAATS